MLEQDKISRIKILLKAYPKGLTITDISSRLKINRNSAAKYLEILQITGVVESQTYGTARVFYLSHRLPISALVSIASDLVVTLDERNRIIFVNDAFSTLFAKKKEDAQGNHILEIFKTGIFSDTLPKVFSDVLADQDTVHEVLVPRDTGDIFFKIKSMKTVFDDGSRGITIIMEDVTREKKDQLELEAKEIRYRGIVEDQTEFVVRFDPHGFLTFSNASFSHYLGKDPEELSKIRFADSICESDQALFFATLKTLSLKKPVMTVECRSEQTPGRVCWIAWTIRALFTGKKGPVEYQAVGQDITEKKEASEKLHEYITQIEFFSKKLQQFIELTPDGNIYHAIGSGLLEIIPDAVISISMYNPVEKTLTPKAVLDGKALDLISHRIGTSLVGLKIPVRDFSLQEGFLTGKVIETHKKLYDITFQKIPGEICAGIENDLNLGDYYSVGIIRQGTILGCLTFALRKGQVLKNRSLIETYIRAASIALQRFNAQSALVESENLYRSVIENIQDVFYRSDAEGNLIMASPSWASLLGYSSVKECLGLNIARDFYMNPEKRKDFIQAITEQGSVTDYEVTLKKKDGTPLYVSTNSHPYYDEKGRVLGIEGIFRDITERKKADHTNRLLSSIVKCSGDAIIGKDTSGTVISWNQAAERLYGYSEEEMIGQHISRIIPPDRQREIDGFFAQIQKGEPVTTRETQRIRKDGRIIDVSVTISPIADYEGRIIGASTIARDITTHKAEARLKKSEDQYRSLVENITVGFYRSTGDPAGHFIWGNSSLVKILGYPSFEKLKEVKIANLFVERDGREKLLNELVREGFVKNKEISLRRETGGTATVLVTALAGFDNAGGLACINGIVEDITPLRLAEQQMQIANTQMQEILATIPCPVVQVNEKNAVVTWNTAMEQLTGIPKKEVIGRKDFDHLFPFYNPSRPALFTLFDASDDDLEKYYPGSYREGPAIIAQVRDLANPDDPSAVVTLRASPFFDHRGTRTGALEIIQAAGPFAKKQ